MAPVTRMAPRAVVAAVTMVTVTMVTAVTGVARRRTSAERATSALLFSMR